MAVDFNTGISVASGFALQAQAPLDIRATVATLEDRNGLISQNATYEGMLVYVVEDKTVYIRTDAEPSASDFSACWRQLLATGGEGGDTSEAVLTTGDQTVAGTKTFSNAIVANGGISATGDTVAFNSKRISGLAEPVDGTDAATKAYVDAVSQGLVVKDPVRAASLSNITATYAAGTAGVGATLTGTGDLPAVDGVTLAVGDRVLVAGQTTATENGIYVVTTASGNFVLTRATDFDNSVAGEIVGGAFCFVQEGTTYADSGFVCTTDGPVTIGTTNITFAQFSGAGQIVAGTGLTKAGNTLSIDSAYAGQASITTVGTITTGTWQGTAVDIAHGGTGATSAEAAFAALAPTAANAGDIMYYDGTKWAALAKGNGVLVADATGVSYKTTLAAGTF